MADGKVRVQHKGITFALPTAVSCPKHKRLSICWRYHRCYQTRQTSSPEVVNLRLPSWAEPGGRECLELLKMQSGTLQIHQQVCHNLLPLTNSQCPFRDLLYIAGGNKIAARYLLAGLAE